MLLRIATSASLILAIAVLMPFCVGCDSVPDMSAPVAASDVTLTRVAEDPVSDDFVIISPSTLVLESQGWGLTVHVDTPFSDVDTSTVNLNGVVPFSTFADDCGDLVAKFIREDIFDLVEEMVGPVEEPIDVTLTISGDYLAGGGFSDTDIITVR